MSLPSDVWAAESCTIGSREGIVTIQVNIDTTNLCSCVYINISQYKCSYKRNRIKTNASTTNSSVTTITILVTIIRRIHYEISLTQQQMQEHEFFQPRNRKKQTN